MDSPSGQSLPQPPSEIGVWQLRRIGPPSTVQNSASLIRLRDDGEVSIGRGPTADYFLDSAVTLRLISRVHALIRGEKAVDGRPRFTITNNGLNGTYINDIKMGFHPDNQQVLCEGDRITFGHPGCASIQSGECAPQHDSEFQFIFECVPASRANTSERYRHLGRTVPQNGYQRHGQYQRQGLAVFAGSNGSRSADSPHSNTSASEKENDINICVKNTLSSNGDLVRSPSKYHHETLHSDSKQNKVMDSDQNLTSGPSTQAKGCNGCATNEKISPVPYCAAQLGSVNSRQGCFKSGASLNSSHVDVNVSGPAAVKNTKVAPPHKEEDVKNMSSPSVNVQSEMKPLSQAHHNVPVLVNYSKSMDRVRDNFKNGIEVHSTTIVLHDKNEDSDSDSDEYSAYSDDDDVQCGCDVEFVSESGPVFPTRIMVKSEKEEYETVCTENENTKGIHVESKYSDMVNAENKKIGLTELSDKSRKKVENKCRNTDKSKDKRIIVGKPSDKCRVSISAEDDFVKAENEGSDIVSSENDSDVLNAENEDSSVVNDSDCNMPSLIAMSDSVPLDSPDTPDSEEGMPSLMLMGCVSEGGDSNEHLSLVRKNSILSDGKEKNHKDTAFSEQMINVDNWKSTSSFPEELQLSDRMNTHPSDESESLKIHKTSCLKKGKKESIDLHGTRGIRDIDTGLSKSQQTKSHSEQGIVSQTLKQRSKVKNGQDADHGLLKSHVAGSGSEQAQTSEVIRTEPTSGIIYDSFPTVRVEKSLMTSSDAGGAKCVHSDLKVNQDSSISNTRPSASGECLLKSLNVQESKRSKSPLQMFHSSQAPHSNSSLLCESSSPRNGSPISNVTTIILSSGKDHKKVSSKSQKDLSDKLKSSKLPKGCKNHHLKQPTASISPKPGSPSDTDLSDPSCSRSSSESSPCSRSSKSSKYSDKKTRCSSELAPKFFKDTVPNMYSSSDEEGPLEENKTEIVKKIYSSVRGKQEEDFARGEVSRRSALFKNHRKSENHLQSDVSESSRMLMTPPPPSKSSATSKPVLSEVDTKKQFKEGEKNVLSPSQISSGLVKVEGASDNRLKETSESKLGKKTESKMVLPPSSVKPKPVVSKQSSSSSLSLTSLPWLTETNGANNSVKNSAKRAKSSSLGPCAKRSRLTSPKVNTLSSNVSDKKDTKQLSSSASTPRTLRDSSKTSKRPLSPIQTRGLKSQRQTSLPRTTTQADTTGLKVSAEHSSSKPSLQKDITKSPLDSKDSIPAMKKGEVKTNHSRKGPATLRSSHTSNDSKVSGSASVPAKKRKGATSETSSLSKPKTRQKPGPPVIDKADDGSGKQESQRRNRKLLQTDSMSSNSSLSRKKSRQSAGTKKGKPARSKKKRKKIVSDTSSDEDDGDGRRDDDDDDDLDVDMLGEDDDDDDDDDGSSKSESWDLPDGVQYYDNLCSAVKCLNPEGKQVDWVMCDNCEQWYHVVCVNCPLDIVQKEDFKFDCGLC